MLLVGTVAVELLANNCKSKFQRSFGTLKKKKKDNFSLSEVFVMCAQKAFCTKIRVVCCVMITYKFLGKSSSNPVHSVSLGALGCFWKLLRCQL